MYTAAVPMVQFFFPGSLPDERAAVAGGETALPAGRVPPAAATEAAAPLRAPRPGPGRRRCSGLRPGVSQDLRYPAAAV